MQSGDFPDSLMKLESRVSETKFKKSESRLSATLTPFLVVTMATRVWVLVYSMPGVTHRSVR